MSLKVKIAVYSGEIPSTTFIERLIIGLSEKDFYIFLYGYQKKKVNYLNKNIFVKSYSNNRVHKLFILFKYSFLLFVFKRKEQQQLNTYIRSSTKNKILSRIKYYPVLWDKPDIFHLQWAKSISDWNWVQEFGIKLVVSLRGTHISVSPISSESLANDYRKYFPIIDGFHAVSKSIANEALKYGADVNRIKIVYSGLPKVKSKLIFKEESKTFEILSIGRNHWIKGYNYALDAMKILSDKKINFQYTIVGGKNSEELIFQKSDLDLNEVVSLRNLVPFAQVQELMQKADVVLLPSVEEGIANVALEAMQLGVIILSTDCGGMNEVIEDSKNGFLIPVRDPEKIAQKILEILQLSEKEKNHVISQAKITIEKKHLDFKMISDMILLYKTVLK